MLASFPNLWYNAVWKMEKQGEVKNSGNYAMFDLRRIGIVRRASAWLLDAILLAVLTTGLMWIISLICGFSQAQGLATQYYNEWKSFRKEEIPAVAEAYGYVYTETGDDDYTITKDGAEAGLEDVTGDLIKGVAEYYGFTYTKTENDGISISKDGAAVTLGDVKETLLASSSARPAFADAFIRYTELPSIDKTNHQYEYVYTLLFMMISVGLALSFLILEFIVPVCLKNGQTVGKKVFSICLVRPNCVRIANVALFGRTILGKYAIETMFPILLVFMFFLGGGGIVTVILFAAIFLLNIILFFATKNRTPIHDVIAVTAAADMKLQMIFASEEELNEKKAQLQKEIAERAES